MESTADTYTVQFAYAFPFAESITVTGSDGATYTIAKPVTITYTNPKSIPGSHSGGNPIRNRRSPARGGDHHPVGDVLSDE